MTDAPEIDKTTVRAHFPPTERRPDSGASVTRLKRKFNNTIEGKEMMKQISTVLVSAVLLLNALGCSTGKVRASAPPSPPVVEVAPVVQKDVPIQGEWVGTLEGYVNAQISPQVSGYLIRQDYREGALVKKGQLLFEIDPRPFQAVLDQAKGQLAQAEAQKANAELNVKRDIPEAEAHAIPQSQLDTDTQSLLGAKAAVEAGQAAVEQAELNLGYTRVVSLIDGIAGINTVQVGNLVGPSTVLTAVSQVSPIKVYFPISEQEYLGMADGGGPGSVDFITHASRIPLQLTLADGSTYPHPGRIIFADRQVNTQTGTIQIVGEFPNSRNLLRPGQYARVQTPTGNITDALLVPQSAVNQQQGTCQVMVIGAGNRTQLRTVEVGPRVGTLWVITSGLKPGERVVAVGADKAKEGEVVNPTPYKEIEEH
jgi:membrane fusion protein (multidrug efflux system)